MFLHVFTCFSMCEVQLEKGFANCVERMARPTLGGAVRPEMSRCEFKVTLMWLPSYVMWPHVNVEKIDSSKISTWGMYEAYIRRIWHISYEMVRNQKNIYYAQTVCLKSTKRAWWGSSDRWWNTESFNLKDFLRQAMTGHPPPRALPCEFKL